MDWYKFNINDLTPEAYQKWYSLMSKKKRAHIDRLRHDDDKKRSVAGEMLVKKSIAEQLKIPPQSIVIEASENGKPYTPNADIHFNISHCEDWVVCAISNTPIGIDIEKIRPINLKIAKRFFNENEQIYIFEKKPNEEDFSVIPTDVILKRFFEIWTAKEAYLKFTGEGITEELKNLKIDKESLTVYYFDDYVVSVYQKK